MLKFLHYKYSFNRVIQLKTAVDCGELLILDMVTLYFICMLENDLL